MYQLYEDDRQRLGQLLVEILLVGSDDLKRLKRLERGSSARLTAFAGFPSPLKLILGADLSLTCRDENETTMQWWRHEPLEAARKRLASFKNELWLNSLDSSRRRPRRVSSLAA